MPPRRRPQVKNEVVDLDAREPSPTQTRVKPPPTAASERVDARSTIASFYRSDAPSADTFRAIADHGETPVLMQTRIRREGGSQPSSPSLLNTDASFAQRSFAHPGFTGIGKQLKACNDTLGNLQQMGIQHVATLPELVLVGDQSAGKSSLMSGLARLNLPRSGGVCTRCPIHIRMSSSNGPQWSCTVSLQQDYEFQPRGRMIKITDVTDRNPFPPWVQKPNRDNKIFKTIYDPAEIENVLRWAQIAILNPSNNHELYVPGEGNIAKDIELAEAANQTEAQFSPNIVALEMKGTDLPDLSFYDLPGVFLSPDKEENDYLVKVVRNLTRSYIRRPEAIIMWALPMNHDLENSISLGIIREAKATDRTIGVITKADMLQMSNIPQWVAVLQGKKQSVKHGYFLTALPPGESLDQVPLQEEFFFRGGVGTWPREFEEYEDQCGVERLREYITKQLGYLHLGRSAMDIRAIRKEITEKKEAGMPINLVPTEVYKAISLREIKKWDGPLDTYMQKTMELLKDLVNSVLESSLENFRQRVIFKDSQALLKEFLLHHEQQLNSRLIDRYHDETYAMFTTNMDAFKRFTAEEAEALERARNFSRLKAAGLIDPHYFSTPLEKMTAEDKKKERHMLNDLLPRLGEDPFKTELQVASTVRGYYMTSATHFVEGVTKDVNARLFRSFGAGELDEYLDRKLELFPYPTPEVYQRLMEEDSQIAKERKQLRGMREKLEIAIDSIQKLEVPFANDDMTETSTHMSTHTTDVDMGEEEELEEEDGTA
ncbi:putative dynamin family protein [Eutypa lata UCREL1]|uniref:Putative dynamin family protein n=1 Tax=Eutypa lata (strain UCR-EL1) TaxID=1287681 RepID=M7SVW7_EUTLA|nr:putative dynamin family protein [Eutypa lata UCREL1]